MSKRAARARAKQAASAPAAFATAQKEQIVAAILKRAAIYLAIFSAGFLLLLALMVGVLAPVFNDLVFSLMRGNEVLYTTITALFWPLVFVAYLVGVLVVVRVAANQALGYFDLLLGSVEGILAHRDRPVDLPPELATTALKLEQVRQAAERSDRAAQAAEQRKNELVVYLAHDIKTPLTSIIGYLTLLDESPDLSAEVRARYTGLTLAKAYRLEELLDEFFEITRYNLQSIPIERSRFDGALFCRQIVDEFYPQAEARDLSITLEAPPELNVFADANKVARVTNNVLKNAVAYADVGSKVHVRTGLVQAKDGFVWWEITVIDHGRELSPSHLERIFEKFYRADEARSSNAGGAGLGLAIAREITRAHGGDIHVASDAGVTSFTIWIPQGPAVARS